MGEMFSCQIGRFRTQDSDNLHVHIVKLVYRADARRIVTSDKHSPRGPYWLIGDAVHR